MEDQISQGSPRPLSTRARRRRWKAATLLGVPAVGLVLAQIVVAAPPVADFTMNGSSAQSLTVNVGSEVALQSTSSDPDGDIETFEWDFDYDGNFTVDAEGETAARPSDAEGSFIVAIRVTDGDSGEGVQTVLRPRTLNVVTPPPPAPTANIAFTVDPPVLPAGWTVGDPALNAAMPVAGQIVNFDGSGSTPAASIGSYAWETDGDNLFDEGADVTLDQAFSTPGPQSVQLRVVANGVPNTDSVSFTINGLPVASFTTSNPTPVINQDVGFFTTSRDPGGGISRFEWDFDEDGVYGDAPTGDIQCSDALDPYPTCQFASAGTYTVGLRVTDTGGISHVTARDIVVQSTVPRASFGFSHASPLPGQAVTFSSTSTPSSNKVLTGYEWDFDYDGVTFTPDATGQSTTRAFSSAGPKTVALKVYEAMPGGGPATGGYAIVSRTITVNAPPTAGMRISPPNPFVGDTATLSSTAADPDGPITAHHWDLDNDGRFDDASGPVVSASYRSAGRRRVTLRVTDSKGAVATASGVIDVRTRPAVSFSVFKVQLGVAYGEFYTDVTRLRVRAPAGTRLTVRCKGKRKGCPRRPVTKKRSKGRMIRFKTLEKRLRPGAKLIVTGTKTGFIGEQTIFTIRSGKVPKRVDRCLKPGAKKVTKCPS